MSASVDIFPKISNEEFARRIVNFKKKMAERKMDLAVIYSNMLDPSACRYFSDFSPVNENAAMIIPLDGEAILCSGFSCHAWSRYKSKVADSRIMPEVGEVSDVVYELEGQLDFLDLFKEMKAKYDIRKIGTIGNLIFPHVIYDKMASTFSDAEIVSAEKMMYELRIQKSPGEIACIRKAAEIISDTLAFAVSNIRPGVTELDIQADLEAQMLRLGAESHCIAFAPMVPTGPERSHLCMNRNSLRRVQESEIICIGTGACYEGYNSAVNTPVVLGRIPPGIAEAVKVARGALELVADNMKPGATAAELYKIYIDFLSSKGYEKYSPYACVHSIGLMECENPFFAPNSGAVMAENMTVCIDAYLTGMDWGSFRIEDTFLITKNGAELLTTFNKEYLPGLYF